MKHVHISISDIIGEQTDSWGFVYPGFMAYMIDWFVGYNYQDGTSGNEELEKVTLHINSPGGDVAEGYAIHNKLLALREKGVEVEVIIEGECYSIATFIALAASPGQLKAREASMWMVHSPWMIAVGNADDMRYYADHLEEFEQPMLNMYVAKTGKTEEEITALLKAEDFMNATRAKEYGFIDEVLTAPSMAAKSTTQKAVAFFNKQNLNTDMATTTALQKKQVKDEKSFMAHVKAFFTGDEAEKPAASNKPKPKAKPKAEATDPVAESTTLADDAGTIYHDGELAEGTAVFEDAEMTTPLEDGTYGLSDGRDIEVADGVVSNIISEEEEEEEGDAAASADTDDAPAPAAQASASKPKKKDPALVALQKENRELKAQLNKVPGGGNSTQKPPQNFNNKTDNGAGGAPDIKAFEAAAEKMKKKLKLN